MSLCKYTSLTGKGPFTVVCDFRKKLEGTSIVHLSLGWSLKTLEETELEILTGRRDWWRFVVDIYDIHVMTVWCDSVM